MIMMICFKHFFVLFCFPIHSFLSALFENINQSDGWMDGWIKIIIKKNNENVQLKKRFLFRKLFPDFLLISKKKWKEIDQKRACMCVVGHCIS